MPAMGGIAERAEIRIMRRDNHSLAAWNQQTMDFFNGFDNIANVLDHMCRANFAEGIVAERKGKTIQICDHVCLGIEVSVQADRAGILVDPAADIK